MRPRDTLELLVLAALWGASFLFMRQAAPEFGPVALIFVRVLLAALFLWPVLAWRGQGRELLRHAGPIAVVGLLGSALPFVLIAWALLSLTAGFASIVNATAALWAALVARLWFGERLTRMRAAGLAIGFVGVGVLVSGNAGFHGEHIALSVVAGLLATLSYGVAANYTRRYLTGVSSLAITTGGQLAAALALAPVAAWLWPAGEISARAWTAAAMLAVACTAVAYILYFRLIANIGPTRAIAVTFLIPAFGMGWGVLVLDEALGLRMLAGAGVILAGTALATGLVDGDRLRRWARRLRSGPMA
ncbi:MAG: DMT family transporter [Rhodocyclaceae bacterium]|nr:DMT family transporter [Rhodocyclaceae bacterium]